MTVDRHSGVEWIAAIGCFHFRTPQISCAHRQQVCCIRPRESPHCLHLCLANHQSVCAKANAFPSIIEDRSFPLSYYWVTEPFLSLQTCTRLFSSPRRSRTARGRSPWNPRSGKSRGRSIHLELPCRRAPAVAPLSRICEVWGGASSQILDHIDSRYFIPSGFETPGGGGAPSAVFTAKRFHLVA